MQIKNGTFLLGDCLELMKDIPSGSIDMILCDLPYGTTACSWDSVIPINHLFDQYMRIAKPNAAIVLTATQPFTTSLMNEALKRKIYKTFMVWNKKQSGSFALAKYHPLRITEDILILGNGSGKLITYNPQMRTGVMRKKGGSKHKNEIHSGLKNIQSENNHYFPTNLIEIVNTRIGKIHPTQKPVELFEYLIKTYTNPGETVLDNCAGSGTTAIAAENTGRKWICMEQLPEYYYKAVARVYDNPSP